MKKTFVSISLLLTLAVTIAGCSTIDVRQYADNKPTFDLFSYFTGTTKGWGIVQDRGGTLLRQFVVDIEGTIDENGNLVLDEDFIWSDGEETKRIWTIAKTGTATYRGTADDVIGEATGEAAGNALNWGYVVALEVDGSTWNITFDDWMFLQPDGILLNRAEMKKFGFRVGEVTIAFEKIVE